MILYLHFQKFEEENEIKPNKKGKWKAPVARKKSKRKNRNQLPLQVYSASTTLDNVRNSRS